jgi:hypothetical protein
MTFENDFSTDTIDLDAALLAGFGLSEAAAEDAAREADDPRNTPPPAELLIRDQIAHEHVTHRLGVVGRLHVTFAYHESHQHD